ncbi:hypothetical protein Hypma_004693 [Hypsizygus marmoreus]|uniref:Uncharacterized protein n=1 Tax=Hypsizygus marmoreus TaxID=39966 RepID=A0A369IZW4_HYPMA|nr:hypothetical protein Hypma_004693 [Hypsizygus marmoreus]
MTRPWEGNELPGDQGNRKAEEGREVEDGSCAIASENFVPTARRRNFGHQNDCGSCLRRPAWRNTTILVADYTVPDLVEPRDGNSETAADWEAMTSWEG